MRHALALLLLLRHAPAQRCTSLAGPDCEIINGRAPVQPTTNAAPAAKPSSWRERLLGVVRAHLEEGRDRADAVKGAFEVRGDLPDADVKPPENVLFVCKLNPVTEDDDLELIFSRFGKIVQCDVIRDYKT